MKLDDQDVTAEVYYESGDTKYLKVKMLGMYISGITARPSPKFPEKGLWIQMPSYQQGGTWKRYIEFDKSSPLKDIVEGKCKEAIDRGHVKPRSRIATTYSLDEPINLKDLPF